MAPNGRADNCRSKASILKIEIRGADSRYAQSAYLYFSFLLILKRSVQKICAGLLIT